MSDVSRQEMQESNSKADLFKLQLLRDFVPAERGVWREEILARTRMEGG